MQQVVSTNVAAVGYDPLTQTMRVKFRSGGTYEYSGVADDLYRSMLMPHPWRRLGDRVKAHPCHKVA